MSAATDDPPPRDDPDAWARLFRLLDEPLSDPAFNDSMATLLANLRPPPKPRA